MFARNETPVPVLGDRGASTRDDAVRRALLDRSGIVAALTDASGVVQWCSPALRSTLVADGDPVGQSLFSLGEGWAVALLPLLRAALDTPGRPNVADIEVGEGSATRTVRITTEDRCADPDVRGVLWWQSSDGASERVERLAHALVNIAREVEWVGFGRRRHVAPVAPIGLLPGSDQLSDRERTVATMLAQGESVGSIAARLYVNPSTVRNYLSSMYRKLGVADLAALRELLARDGVLEAHVVDFPNR
jgi:DNA-binding CsgD family transcriptional regulator